MMNWKQLSGKFILNLALFICVGGELPLEVNDRDAVQHNADGFEKSINTLEAIDTKISSQNENSLITEEQYDFFVAEEQRELQFGLALGITALVTAVAVETFVDLVLTGSPTPAPSSYPIATPSLMPSRSFVPSRRPSEVPSIKPSLTPSIFRPSLFPSQIPTNAPSIDNSEPTNVFADMFFFTQFLDFLWRLFFLSFVQGVRAIGIV